MKKGLKVLSIAAFTLLLGSCTNSVVENQIQTQIKREEVKVNEENKKMCEDALTYIDLNVDKNRIVTDLKLPSSGMYKTFLQWESSNPEVLPYWHPAIHHMAVCPHKNLLILHHQSLHL